MRRWSPLKAAIITFVVVIVVACVVSIAVASAMGRLHDAPFERGEKIGQGVGMLATLSAVAAYFIQSRRVGK